MAPQQQPMFIGTQSMYPLLPVSTGSDMISDGATLRSLARINEPTGGAAVWQVVDAELQGKTFVYGKVNGWQTSIIETLLLRLSKEQQNYKFIGRDTCSPPSSLTSLLPVAAV